MGWTTLDELSNSPTKRQEWGLALENLKQLAELKVGDIYGVFKTIADWAEWYALYWAWRSDEIEEQYPTSNESDWRKWVAEDFRFVLLDDGKVVEMDH